MAADMLQQASDWLEDQRTRHAASTVQYVRGGQAVEVLATVGKTTFEVDDGYGVLVRHESRDFLVLAADLVLGGVATTPERGRSSPPDPRRQNLCLRGDGARQGTLLALQRRLSQNATRSHQADRYGGDTMTRRWFLLADVEKNRE